MFVQFHDIDDRIINMDLVREISFSVIDTKLSIIKQYQIQLDMGDTIKTLKYFDIEVYMKDKRYLENGIYTI